ncbi:MAG: histone deacetylase family protein [Calditrichaceae bacterium]|nr:histone deacetylase family protein [Calditrichaceae bacterium]HES59610.1 histone deacetylase family protein [Caldithrix sp.]
MFRIRQIYDSSLPINRDAIAQAQQILRSQFNALSEEDINKLPDQLNDPLHYRFRSILLVADDSRGNIKGFALLMHAPDRNFCYLDFISAAKHKTGRGIGSILYEAVREHALQLNVPGLFFECLPDDPALCKDPATLDQNIARLRFYERYGARPIVNTAYETPVNPGDDCPPYLVFDDLGREIKLSAKTLKSIVKAILERKYGNVCPTDYIKKIVDSIKDDPVRLRPLKYIKKSKAVPVKPVTSLEEIIALILNDKHDIHHVRERGYVEAPVRIKSITEELMQTGLFRILPTRYFSEKYIRSVHNGAFVTYLKKVCANVPANKSVYPYVFPIRNAARPPKELPVRAGYYCIDTFTPLNHNAYIAAKRAVDCTMTAARSLLEGFRMAYALVRPPGHHAEQKSFGGFCYFNSNAVAANYLSQYGRIAILDIDYHHGNGQQDIFYKRDDVLTISIHGHPRFAYPYFSGFAEENGLDKGTGFNINYPMPEQLNGEKYRQVLQTAIRKIRQFDPKFLIVPLGLDTAKGDPTGTWTLNPGDFELNGRMIGSLKLPTLVVQEGGYKVRSLGLNARYFFTGLWNGCCAKPLPTNHGVK